MTGMIVCPQPLAAKVGQDVLAAGGNAVDVAVAAAFVQSVVDPLMVGLGGTGLIHYYDGKTRESVVLNCEVAIGSRAGAGAVGRRVRGARRDDRPLHPQERARTRSATGR